MSILIRLHRLWKADVHSLLDSIEEPSAVLRQAVREMEEIIAASEARLEQEVRRKVELEELRECKRAEYAETQRQLELCFEEQNESLLRGLMRKKLSGARALEQLDRAVAAAERAVTELNSRVEARREELQRIREEAALAAAAPGQRQERCAAAPSDDEVEVALLEERRKWHQSRKESANEQRA